MNRKYSVEVTNKDKIIWSLLTPILTLLITIGSNYFTYTLSYNVYQEDKKNTLETIKMQKKQIDDLQQVNRINALITLGDKMSGNIDAVNIIEAGLTQVNDKELLDNVANMKAKFAERYRSDIRRRISQLYDSSDVIRKIAVTEILNIASSETVGDIIGIMKEYDDFYSKNNRSSLTKGRYNSMYIISLLDTSLFGIQYNGTKYVVVGDATEKQKQNLETLREFIKSYRNNSEVSMDQDYYNMVTHIYTNND